MGEQQTLQDEEIKTVWSRTKDRGAVMLADPDNADPDGSDTDGTDSDTDSTDSDSDSKDS
jgi:hypothetical protein